MAFYPSDEEGWLDSNLRFLLRAAHTNFTFDVPDFAIALDVLGEHLTNIEPKSGTGSFAPVNVAR